MWGGTQGAIFMCYSTLPWQHYHGNQTLQPTMEWAKMAYHPVRWDFAIVQDEGNFIQYSDYSDNC